MSRGRRQFLIAAAALLLAIAGWRWLPIDQHRPDAPGATGAVGPGGELVASLRSDPPSYNRLVRNAAATDLVSLLTQARLVRVNRATDDLEPWLAERWSVSEDGLTYTLTLRPARFSDGVAFTAADVLFSFEAVYDERVNSPVRGSLEVGGQPLHVSAPDAATVVVRFPGPFAPGLRLLDNLPILPKHKLAPALAAGTFADAWTPAAPLDSVAGLGPFVLSEHLSGQRLVFTRNPHYFRRDGGGRTLPYLDKLTVLIIGDQNTEALRLQAGQIDLMSHGDIRPQDHASFTRLEADGRLRLYRIGTSLDPDFLWFNLSPKGVPTPGRALLRRKEFRQAISYAVDRQMLADTVYLGAAVAISGPVSPGNTKWYAPAPVPGHDAGRARALLNGLGLADSDGDGMLETRDGVPARFSMLSQAGHLRGRTASVLQAQLQQAGIGVDLVALDPGALFQRFQDGDYDSIYFGLQASSTDPALNLDFWLSSGASHFWNPAQPAPSTDWEERIDRLMRTQAQAPTLEERRRAFAEVQRIMNDELPAIYFVAPLVTVATTPRVLNPTPVLQLPQLLWSADTLARSAGPAELR
jgi:peptide/nickel transport system substrate-binding protein